MSKEYLKEHLFDINGNDANDDIGTHNNNDIVNTISSILANGVIRLAERKNKSLAYEVLEKQTSYNQTLKQEDKQGKNVTHEPMEESTGLVKGIELNSLWVNNERNY
jgi:hypothetical protein